MAQPTKNELLKPVVNKTPVVVQPPVDKKPVAVTPVVNKTPVKTPVAAPVVNKTPVKSPIVNAQKAITGYKKPALKDVSQPTTFSATDNLGLAAAAGTDWYNPWNDKQQSKLDYATSLIGKVEDANKRGLGEIDKALGGSGAIGEGLGSVVNTGLEFVGYGKALGLAGKAVAPLAKMVAKTPVKVAAMPYNALKNAAIKGGMARSAMALDMGAAAPLTSKIGGLAYKGLNKVGNKAGAVTDAIGDAAFKAVGKALVPVKHVVAGSLATGYDAPKIVYDEDGFAKNSSFANTKKVFSADSGLAPIEMPGKFVTGLGRTMDEVVDRNNPLNRPKEWGESISRLLSGVTIADTPRVSTVKTFDPRIDEQKAAEAQLVANVISTSPINARKQAALTAANKELEDFQGDDQQTREKAQEAARLELWMAEHNGDIKGYAPKKNTTQNKLLDEKDEAQQAVENRARMVQMYKDNETVEALPQGSTARAKKELELSKARQKAAKDKETATETAENLKSATLAQEQVAMEKEIQTKTEEGKPLDNTPKGLAARYEAKRLEAEIADKDFKAADELKETPENYYLLQARSLERDKELRELKELAGVADAEPVFDEDTPEFKAYSAKVDAFNAVADDDKVADEVKDKLEAEMNAAEKEVFPLYAPANATEESASTDESEAGDAAPIATPATVKPATVAPTTATATAESEADTEEDTPAPVAAPATAATATDTSTPATVKPAASKFSRIATGVADTKGNFINGDKEAARAALSRNDAYPTADKDYLDNRLMNGTLTPAEYAKQLKAKPTPSKGGTFSVMSTTVADKAPEAPAAAPDPYAAIIQQLTNQMNNTGQDFASRRKAVTAKAALKDVLAQREQSMDRAQRETQAMREAAARETQAMREAAVRATEFDYRKGRDVTGDARYEAEKARLYGNDDLDRKERTEDKRYERLQHAKEWLALNENQRAQLQNQKVAALRSRLSDTDMYGEDTADLWGL